jgi:opacity protein-like surface antigen
MKSLNMKLALAAVAVAALASPAFAAHIHQQASQQPDYATNGTFQRGQFYTYPNGAVKTGSAENVESGAEFNLLQHPIE